MLALRSSHIDFVKQLNFTSKGLFRDALTEASMMRDDMLSKQAPKDASMTALSLSG